ncbi:MAG: hypothetical protein A2X08_02690 [Bacteroidetes bacterium GWA2_32_17]|nr:MAG: hypothetical protein A2X08_02690 [Bacteroidetes bacterium GWA2_32_17]
MYIIRFLIVMRCGGNIQGVINVAVVQIINISLLVIQLLIVSHIIKSKNQELSILKICQDFVQIL